ncbi:related to DNA damage response protein [Cephalotrichum gorgonifer]|uniref:Related to DNA damage response protein n=1 Tax=Cephalotrichum gorgonifer TaxID=2041049 RepID=A0AAE8SWS6_9PEZI|nr:related to DNA damage response protein [Cephalotrichum gorgonifer]
MADSAGLRHRKAPTAEAKAPASENEASETEAPAAEDKPRKLKKKVRARDLEDDDPYTPWVDILRVISFLFVASCALSYLVSSGESFFWGMKNKPNYMRLDWWKSHFQPPLELTLEELAAYDGTDTSKPIYLAINGTIYDVSAGARIYGPGGSYHWFAGCDASRAYVTGCFSEDRTADMRGVEEMYLPLEDPEVNSHFTKEELSAMRKEELAEARRKVKDGLRHWVTFFANSPKYNKVGTVKREKGWLKALPRRELCEAAQKGRSPRKIPEEKKGDA